jgi:hypothetical protein
MPTSPTTHRVGVAPPTPRSTTRRLCAVLAAGMLVAALAAPGAAPASRGEASAEGSAKHQGLGTAHVAWWRWAFSFPFSGHPLNPESGATCATGQTGKTWYLGGVFNATGTITRECTVPAGTSLVVAVANLECSTLEPPPFHGSDPASLSRCARGVARPDDLLFNSERFATLDARPVRVERAPSPLFRFSVPSLTDNILGCPGGCSSTSGESVADGYIARLHPLRIGDHTLHFGGTFPNLGFALDITYELTVVPRRRD